MKKYPVLVVLIALLLMLNVVVSAQDQLEEVKANGVLRFGTSADYIPFVYMDGTTLTGMDVELAKAVGERLGVAVQTVDMAFDGLIDSLTIGQVDMIGGAFSIIDERKQQIDFSRPYYAGKGVVVAAASSTLTKDAGEAIWNTVRVGVQSGSHFDQWVKSNLLMGGHVETKNVYTFAKIEEAMHAIDNDEIDIVLIDEDVYIGEYKSSGNYKIIDDELLKEKYGFAFAKGSTLTAAVDEALNAMIEDGTAQKIADAFFAVEFNRPAEATISRPAQSMPAPQPAPVQSQYPQQQNCANGMQFVTDLSIPDSTRLNPGVPFTKSWRIKNTGTCTWNGGYSFNYVRGAHMGTDTVTITHDVAPGSTYDVSVDMTAPQSAGSTVGYWQMRSAAGQNFGQTIWVNIFVTGSTTALAPGGNGPVIETWQPNFYSGSGCPVVYWNVINASQVEFYINNQYQLNTTIMNGSTTLCPTGGAGKYNYAIRAVGNSAASFAFTFNSTSNVVPVVQATSPVVPVIQATVPPVPVIGGGVTVTGNTGPAIGGGVTVTGNTGPAIGDGVVVIGQ